DAEMRLRDAASKKILVEISLLRAIEARNALPIDAVLKQLNQLRAQPGAVMPAAATNPPAKTFLSASAIPAETTRPQTPAPKPAAVATAPVELANLMESDGAAPLPITATAPGVFDLIDLWQKLI